MNLPAVFVSNILHAFPAEGEKWLASLPQLLKDASQRWDLTLGEPYVLSYNYVCAATLRNGRPVVLKIGIPNPELSSEITALRLYKGEGACLLYEADPEAGMLVMERLQPGRMLYQYSTDERETTIAARLMKRLFRPAPKDDTLIPLRRWFRDLKNLRLRFKGGTGPFPKRLVETVESLLPGLFSDARASVLLHGDFHHYNILDSSRGWLIIDPKGVTGPAGYEPAPYLMNPIDEFSRLPDAGQVTERRIKIFSEILGMDSKHLLDWAICHSLLSAWWDTNASGKGGEYSIACGEIFLKVKL
jgi:streptomycin 6-kinase